MSMPLFPIARRLVAGAFVLTAFAASSLSAQTEPVPRPTPVRPVPVDPQPGPVVTPGGGIGGFLNLGSSTSQIAILTAGDTFSELFPVGCSLGRTTVDLSVTVDPPAFAATLSVTRVTTPSEVTVTAPIPLTTPANEYRIALTATRVSGPCTSNSITRVVLVEKPIRLEVEPASQTVAAGATTSYNVTIQRKNGANGRVTLRTTDLPSDIVSSFDPAATNGNTSTLKLSVAAGSTSCPPPNGCDFRIRGMAANNVEVQAVAAKLIVSKQVALRVDNPTRTVQLGSPATFDVQVMRSGFAGNVRLRSDIVDRSGNVNFTSFFDPSDFSTAPTVRFEVTPSGGPGRLRFRLTPELQGSPTDVAIVPVEVTIEAQAPRGVSVVLTPPNRTVARGASTTYDLQIVKNGVPSVRFGSARGLPSNVATVTPDRAVDPTRITVAVAPNAPEDTYRFDVLVQYDEDGGAIVSTASNEVELEVGGGGGMLGSVVLEVDPTVKDIDAGSSRTFTVTARPQGGFAGWVNLQYLQAPGSPMMSASFSDTEIDLSTGLPGSSILTLGAPAGAATGGPFQSMVMGTAMPAVTVTPGRVNYRILAANQPSLSLSLAPATFNLRSGDPLTVTATVTRFSNCTAPITLNGLVNPFTAFGSISFQPVAGTPDTFRANLVAGTVTADTPATISVSAFAQGCVSASRQITGTVRPKVLIPPQVPAPTITGFTPASGGSGTAVRIMGSNLGNASSVAIGSAGQGFFPLGIVLMTPTEIQVLIGTDSPTGFFRITTPAGTVTSTTAFQVTTPNQPQIGGFNPISGPSGTRVEIIGVNLGTATQVTFNGLPASFEPPQPNRVFATVPSGATTGPIRITTPAGTATSFMPFAVSSGGPVITGFQPPSGREGDSITIAGVNFTGVTEVTFNGVSGSIGIVTANFVQVFVPGGATTGPIRLTTPAGTATSPSNFVILP